MKKKRKNQTVGVRFAALLIMGVTIILYFMLEKNIGSPNAGVEAPSRFEPTGVSFDFEVEDRADFYVTEKGSFFFCTKDGVRFYSMSGEKKWDKVFNMIHPMIYGEGELLAVAESKGRELYVYDASGLKYALQFEYPILRFSVNRIGYVSVILQKDDEYEIRVYDENGGESPLWQWNAQDYNVFPVDCAVSNDGKIVAFSLFDINDVNPESMIIFAYLEKSVQTAKYPESIFSSKRKPNQLVGVLKFMDDGMLISVSDEEIVGMWIDGNSGLTDKVTDKWAIQFNNKVDKISYNGGKGFALALGDGLLNKAPEPVGAVKYYNLKGESTGEYLPGDKLSFLWAGADTMLIGTATGVYAVDNKGKNLWEHKAGLQVKNVMLLGNSNNILTVSNTKAELLKRAKK